MLAQLPEDLPEYWRARAADTRAMADKVCADAAAKTALQKIADGYDYLAESATRRARLRREI
jgi:hypothetical protein